MGLVFVDGVAVGPTGATAPVRFLVDSGATYSLLPDGVWRALGLVATRTQPFSLADGSTVDRRISECLLRLPQGEGHSPVILGEPGDEALLAVVTLEIMGLVLNPFNRTLQPMRLRLA